MLGGATIPEFNEARLIGRDESARKGREERKKKLVKYGPGDFNPHKKHSYKKGKFWMSQTNIKSPEMR